MGLLITPFTIIIASITQPDTGKKTVESGRARSQKYPTEREVGESRRGKDKENETWGIKTKRHSERMGGIKEVGYFRDWKRVIYK